MQISGFTPLFPSQRLPSGVSEGRKKEKAARGGPQSPKCQSNTKEASERERDVTLETEISLNLTRNILY